MLEDDGRDGESTHARYEKSNDKVNGRDQPEGELVQRLVTKIHGGAVYVVWLVDAVHPHTACKYGVQ